MSLHGDSHQRNESFEGTTLSSVCSGIPSHAQTW